MRIDTLVTKRLDEPTICTTMMEFPLIVLDTNENVGDQ
jgi:hypothetical protein